MLGLVSASARADTEAACRPHRGRGLGSTGAVASGDDGIDVDAPGTTVTGNVADHNHDLRIEAVPGVVDGGGNHANGNGNPAQCTDVAC
jgi:hypothetical protein